MNFNKTLTLLLLPLLLLIAINTNAQQLSANMQEGTAFFRNKQYDKALKRFQKEYKTNPSIEVKFWIAHTYAEMEDIENALTLFLEIVRRNVSGPEIAMSLTNIGICYTKKEQKDSAYFYFNKAINDFPEFASAYLDRGQLLYTEGKFNLAKKSFDKAIELDSTNWWAYQKRLEVCFATQNYEGALHDLIKVKQLHPELKNDMNLAFCYTMLKRYVEADSIFQLIYNDNDAIFLNNYGMNKHNMGMSSQGKEIIMKSLRLQPNNSYAYRNLAVIAMEEKDQTKICEYLNKAKDLGFEKYYGTEVNELLLKHCN